MTTARRQRIFGERGKAHTIIIARGDEVRHFTVRPRVVRMVAAALLGTAALGIWFGVQFHAETGPSYFAENSGTLVSSYELRIASLRSEVDRLTTRGFLDRQKMSSKVDILLEQQAALAERDAKLQPILDRARSNGLIDTAVPKPQAKPVSGRSDKAMESGGPLAFVEPAGARTLDRFKLVDRRNADDPIAPDVIRNIGRSIDEAEMRQIESLDLLTSNARAKTEAIGDALQSEGVGRVLPPKAAHDGEGGPFVPVPPDHRFEAGLLELSAALDRLQGVRKASRALPLAAPVASTAISSTFGIREDPFLGKAAMHTGIDFVAEAGTAVAATAAGTVTFAGENGGYGRMVEVDHGNGLTTRYAHLSEIAVIVGDKVALGGTVGRVGSTGRSTGPHLHYEVRRTGEAVDPSRFLKAGRRIDALG